MARSNRTLCGIYQIRNLVNGKVYVGSSADIKKRLCAHKSTLGRNTHHSILLQNAWNKHGAKAFAFEVLELVVDPAQLHVIENSYMQRLRATDREHGYNICPAAGSLLGIKFGPHSPEHRRKIGEAHKGRVVSAETRALMSAQRKGMKLTAEWIENMRKAQIGRKMKPLSDAHKAIVSATHKGKTISDAHKARLSEVHKGRKLSDEDKAKKRAAGKTFWATQTPEQRAARIAKTVATKAAKRAAAMPQPTSPA